MNESPQVSLSSSLRRGCGGSKLKRRGDIQLLNGESTGGNLYLWIAVLTGVFAFTRGKRFGGSLLSAEAGRLIGRGAPRLIADLVGAGSPDAGLRGRRYMNRKTKTAAGPFGPAAAWVSKQTLTISLRLPRRCPCAGNRARRLLRASVRARFRLVLRAAFRSGAGYCDSAPGRCPRESGGP